ncbi:hypothetical protein [Streptomyces sp. JB150]|uniref:hypothetical protein n=1 Tax=Streptomyces sp. JB150 TaxID=2714844 RepID=UPI00140A0914|nr:hypothetical protein [Streptomyces sp. JB150]QIJ63227.1 hypothetical protein G7Z13_15175 [Streptomyces sp. JB150]
MPEHVSILQWAGVAVLAAAAVIWVMVLARLLRRGRPGTAVGTGAWAAARTGARPLGALPRQRENGPHRESVRLTPAEEAAFAVLVRRLGDEH